MKRIPLIFILFSVLFVMAACTSDETVKNEVVLPEDIPDFVQISDFETIDWEKKAVEFGDRNIVGNENKSGVIGQDMKSAKVEKWMWHLWGVEEPENKKLTIVGFHKETETVHQILIDGWTRDLVDQTMVQMHIFLLM